ncbi:MAG: hypothetical protein IPP55_01810 [Anaerolineales bacterium]|jgi:hypothetical protein|nr:hypothetical protein [Anaerolineales bacterium]
MSSTDERDVNPIQEIINLVENVSGLKTFGFLRNFQKVETNIVIYNSEQCRVKVVWGGWDPSAGNSISIYYGRLHAPDENIKMIWNEEECHCWHRFEHVIHFLNGVSPVEAAKLDYSTPITSNYFIDEVRNKFHRRQPEWLMHMHMDVWKHYGANFFELFDLRRPDLWERYRKFLKEMYDVQGRIPFIKPPMDKVC